jgi:acyl-CoA thioesterase-2
MGQTVADLVKLLDLEPLDVNLFRGMSRDIGSQRVFGGQVLGQSLVAACRTVENRLVHSMHAYFLRGGDTERPIIYDVDRARDGKSFATRRVVARQYGEQIFHASVSFQIPESGLEHQSPPPDVPDPDQLLDWVTWIQQSGQDIPSARVAMSGLPFELRFVEPEAVFLKMEPQEPRINLWFRTIGRLPDGENLHRCILAYASDLFLIGAAFLPHARGVVAPDLQVTSLDHAMWFHRPLRVDDWLLYSIDSPNASGARGLSRGSIYTRDGVLVASTAQEGLMRYRPKGAGSTNQ